METRVIFLATVIFAFFKHDVISVNHIDGTQTTLAKQGRNPFAAHISWHAEDVPHRVGRALRPTPFNCTGMIIHRLFVVTAASCFTEVIKGLKHDDQPLTLNLTHARILVRVRVVLWDGTGPGYPEPSNQTRVGGLLHIHTNYLHQSTMFDVDIALMQTHRPWEIEPVHRFQPRFAKHINEDDFIVCAAARIGFIDANGIENLDGGRIRYYRVRVGREKYCKYMQIRQNKRQLHFDKFYLCATPTEQSVQQTCNGDVGGPLFCNGLLAGVLSQRREKKRCDEDGTSYLMYTAIGTANVLDWIKRFVPGLPEPEEIPIEDPWPTTPSTSTTEWRRRQAISI